VPACIKLVNSYNNILELQKIEGDVDVDNLLAEHLEPNSSKAPESFEKVACIVL
jgi:hypothetical protein